MFDDQVVKYFNPVQIQMRNLYSLKLDLNCYMQIGYNAVYDIVQTAEKQRFCIFVLFFMHLTSIALKAAVEIIVIETIS